MVAPDCFGCRASVPRYCASCVQQAITERRQRLKEIEGDKYRLERGMRPSLAQRRRLLEQREARRVHAASTARLSAELTSVRAESDRQAITVNEIRHAIRRHQLQLQQPPKLTRASRGIRAVRTGYAYQPPACSMYRRHRAACPRPPTHCAYHAPWHHRQEPPPPPPTTEAGERLEEEQRELEAQRLAAAGRHLTECRRSLVRQLLRLHQMQWLHPSPQQAREGEGEGEGEGGV